MNNVNEKTGIPYGYVSGNALDDELVNTLLFEVGKDLSYRDALEHRAKECGFEGTGYEAAEEYMVEHHDSMLDAWMQEYQYDEPIVEGNYEGVQYLSSWLGGALHFFIAESPVVTDDAVECSPCVPGAGNLDQVGEGHYSCYSVPDSWFADNCN